MANIQAKPPVYPIPLQILFDMGQSQETLNAGRLLLFIHRNLHGRWYFKEKSQVKIVEEFFTVKEIEAYSDILISCKVVYTNKKPYYIAIPDLLGVYYNKYRQQCLDGNLFCTIEHISNSALIDREKWLEESAYFLSPPDVFTTVFDVNL